MLVAIPVGLMTLVMVTRETDGVTVTVDTGDAVGVTVTVAEAGHVEPVAPLVTVIVEGATTLPEAVTVAVT